jgi:hypothetical protein
MRATAKFVAALSLAAFACAVSGCQKEGPAERAGKDIDKAVKKLTQDVEPIGLVRRDAGLAQGR